jgi:hypothetical protein
MTEIKEGDYVRILCKYYKGKYGKVVMKLINFYPLRVQFSERYDGGAFELNEVKKVTKKEYDEGRLLEEL